MSILGIDVDGVLADFNSTFIDRIIAVTGKDLFPPRPFDIPVWDYPEHYKYTKAETSAVWESIKSDDHFWETLPAYPDTEQTLTRLSGLDDNGYDIYFITSRPGKDAKHQTEAWLRHHGFLARPTVLLSGAKGLCAEALTLDKYIDDRWENCVDAQRFTGCETFLLTRPWNIQHRCVEGNINRITTLAEMF